MYVLFKNVKRETVISFLLQETLRRLLNKIFILITDSRKMQGISTYGGTTPSVDEIVSSRTYSGVIKKDPRQCHSEMFRNIRSRSTNRQR